NARRFRAAQISAWLPSSMTRFGGMRKKSVAASALRCMTSNSWQRTRPSREIFAGTIAFDKERRVHHVERKTARSTVEQHPRHVRMLHEAVLSDNRIEIVAEIIHCETPLGRNARNNSGDDTQQHDALVQHLVVFQVVLPYHVEQRKTP